MRLSLACLTTVALLGWVGPAAAEPLKVGDTVPEWTMVGSDGKTYSSASLKGKAYVVAWYPKAFTGGCTKECKSFREAGEQLKAIQNFAYFTASTDTVEKNTDFAKSLDLDYPILSDPTLAAAKAFGVLNERKLASRVTFFVDAAGVVKHTIANKTEGHGAEVAAKVKDLGLAP